MQLCEQPEHLPPQQPLPFFMLRTASTSHTARTAIITISISKNHPNKRIHAEGRQPCHAALRDHDEHRFHSAAKLAPERRQSRHAGRVQQGKHQKHDGRERGKQRGQCGGVPAQKDRQRRDNALLGRKAGDQRSGNAPVAKAEGREHRRYPCADDGKQTVGAALADNVEAHVEVLQKPYDNGRRENDGERAADEVPRLFPHEQQNAFERRHAVVRKLHDKRHGLACERRFAEHLCRYYAHEHAENIQAGHDKAAVIREERRREHGIDRYLRRAAHKRNEQHRHLAVALGRERARCHDGRNRAAEADEHRNKAAARQADAAQQLIHDKRNARHVARVLQNCKEEEQHHDYRQKAQHAADAGEHAVNDKAVDDRV